MNSIRRTRTCSSRAKTIPLLLCTSLCLLGLTACEAVSSAPEFSADDQPSVSPAGPLEAESALSRRFTQVSPGRFRVQSLGLEAELSEDGLLARHGEETLLLRTISIDGVEATGEPEMGGPAWLSRFGRR